MMKILTVDNTPYELDTVPEEIDDLRYCVLDASDPDGADFFFLPLIFLESFHAPAICLKIGNRSINMPMDWSILICDSEFSAVEVLPLTSLSNRGFNAVCMNPMVNSSVRSEEVTITNVYNDIKWYFPKLKNGHMITIPLEDKPNPKCAFFVKEANKIGDLDLADLL
jgi:hypothetical protein